MKRRLWREVLAAGGLAMIASLSSSNAGAAVDAGGPLEATTAQGDDPRQPMLPAPVKEDLP